ncbi:Alpha-1,6-mannosylglycoprotein 6-beta-N-acetylglucosaminyltransferase B [Liparis tanakae]|uniref:alpha-1,6-mannosyl-glycoprotein 6-beta-N-acetylglucosaminyltransferase n=1 Tax=Liparis tanakae TaxID=230148 RepID=A0A4Z2FQZ9_9TELE|nr:Alpha-1,6-mannosylglycoprotein 6-beta-N-acetylglucosaminyltransferase B [Liparis tanakae]
MLTMESCLLHRFKRSPVCLLPPSGCLVLCLCLSVLTLLLQSLWVPLEMSRGGAAGRSPEEQGRRGLGSRRLALRLEALSTQVQKLSRERGHDPQLSREDLSVLLHRPLHAALTASLSSWREEACEVPTDRAYPLCAEKVEFLRARWQTDPCYAFYGVDGTTCSILTYLSQIEDFCPVGVGGNRSAPPWHQEPHAYTEKNLSPQVILSHRVKENEAYITFPSQAEIRTTLSPLYEVLGSGAAGPAVTFIRSRVERMSERWTRAARRMRRSSNTTASTQMRVLLYPGALAGPGGPGFEALVERGGPLGELVQWADLSACLTILGHNLTFSTSQQLLHSSMSFCLYVSRNSSRFPSRVPQSSDAGVCAHIGMK